MIKHVSFDFDGVVIDSLECMEFAWEHSCNILEINRRFSEYIIHIGIPFEQILQKLDIPPSSAFLLTCLYSVLSSARIDLIRIYPGVKDAINGMKLKGIRLSLVTSKSRKRTLELLSKLDLELFDTVVTPDDVPLGKGKPCPDPLILACSNVNEAADTTIYIGDMKTDYLCAKSAGSLFCYASWGYGERFWNPPDSMSLSSPLDLPAFLDKISTFANS